MTFGIKPTYPAEIFGYIQRGARRIDVGARPSTRPALFKVQQFKEKPDAATAKKYVDSGEYYWNSGIFVWQAKTILDALRQRQPEMLATWKRSSTPGTRSERDAVFEREFTAIKPISIDYAVMEHATDVAVIEAPFEWDDLGGWQSLARLVGSDDNAIRSSASTWGSTPPARSSARTTITWSSRSGSKTCIVVHTPNATLVANKHNEEQIRQVVKRLEELGWSEYL